MALEHSTGARNAMAQAIADYVDSGTGTAVFRLRQGTTTLADIDLQDPAFGSPTDGTIQVQGTPLTDDAIAAGDVDNFQVLNQDGNVAYEGTVTAQGGGGDIEVTNTSIAIGQECRITAHSWTAPS